MRTFTKLVPQIWRSSSRLTSDRIRSLPFRGRGRHRLGGSSSPSLSDHLADRIWNIQWATIH